MHFGPYVWIFWAFYGLKRGFISSYKGILEAPRGAPKLQKWTSDDYPVNICQLDYYVVLGAQSGLLQDLELSLIHI